MKRCSAYRLLHTPGDVQFFSGKLWDIYRPIRKTEIPAGALTLTGKYYRLLDPVQNPRVYIWMANDHTPYPRKNISFSPCPVRIKRWRKHLRAMRHPSDFKLRTHPFKKDASRYSRRKSKLLLKISDPEGDADFKQQFGLSDHNWW